jgi:VIT1/CCC1 family predicted Fe2+/Mn2+ transporter
MEREKRFRFVRDKESEETIMTTIVCTPDYYPAVFVVVGFLVAIAGMFLGRYIKEKYGRPAE